MNIGYVIYYASTNNVTIPITEVGVWVHYLPALLLEQRTM